MRVPAIVRGFNFRIIYSDFRDSEMVGIHVRSGKPSHTELVKCR